MKIAFIHPSFPTSEGTGATHSATKIVNMLQSRGHRVQVYCTSEIPQDEIGNEDLSQLVGEIPFLGQFGKELNDAILSRAREFERYDILHCYLPRGMPAVGRISNNYDVKTVLTLNSYGAICPKNDLMYMEKTNCKSNSRYKCLKCTTNEMVQESNYEIDSTIEKGIKIPYRVFKRQCRANRVLKGQKYSDNIDAFRAPSPHVLKHHVKFGFDSEKIWTIPHPIDELFQIKHKSDFSPPYKLLYVGSLEKEKGADRLIPLLNILSNKHGGDYIMNIIGDGYMENYIENQVAKYNLHHNVDLRGHIEYEDLPKIYSNSDIFVYPGRLDEPLARVFLEALATRTPVVTTNIGDISTMLGKACRESKQSIDGLAKNVQNISNKKTLIEISNACESMQKFFMEESVVSMIEQMYDSILN